MEARRTASLDLLSTGLLALKSGWMKKRCPIFFIFWQPSFIWAEKAGVWELLLKMWNDKTSSISIYSYTFKSHLLLYECPCISPSLPTVHLPGQQQRKPRLTEGLHSNTHDDCSLVPPSAGSLLLTSSWPPNIETDPPLDLLFSLTHPRSQQSRSLSQAQDLVSLAHK